MNVLKIILLHGKQDVTANNRWYYVQLVKKKKKKSENSCSPLPGSEHNLKSVCNYIFKKTVPP